MLQLWIHRTEILQEQFDGIDLPLTEQRRCGLGRRRSHDRRERRQECKANRPVLSPLD